MAIDNFVPEVWSAAVQEALQNEGVLTPICTANYTGTAALGNAVNVTGVVPPTLSDYTGTTNSEDVADLGFKLQIDKQKKFDYAVDDIDAVQAAGSFDQWAAETGRTISFNADVEILKAAKLNGTDATAGVTPVEDAASAFNAIRDLRKIMTKAKIPTTQRYLVLNAEFSALLLSSDAKLTAVNESGTDAGLRNGVLGRLLNFTIVESEAFADADADVPTACAFWKPALPYVEQIMEVEAMRHHAKFADRVRGLHVFGTDVVDFYSTGVQFYRYDEA